MSLFSCREKRTFLSIMEVAVNTLKTRTFFLN